MINLEVKVHVPDLEQIKEKALQLGASGTALLRQTDTYFLIGKRRLKLRNENGKTCLIFYVRPDTTESKFSNYHIVYISKHCSIVTRKILSYIFGLKIVVRKERMLCLYKHTRIHLDKVEGLGNFVELETVFEGGLPEKTLKAEHESILHSLGLHDLEKVKDSYSDLMIVKSL